MRGGDERIGKLREKVTILTATRTEDPVSGEVLTTWGQAVVVPASIKASQSEEERGKRLAKITKLDLVVRYREDLENGTGKRLSIAGTTFEIIAAIDPTRRKRWLQITATATE